MSEHPLHQIMHPRSVAIAGASNDTFKMGSIQLLNLLGGKYEGKIFPIHPEQDPILGLKSYRRGSELPEPADLAIVTIPPAAVPGVLQDLGKRGVKRAIVISGGFKEMPVAVGPARLAVARLLREQFPEIDVIVSDDGLQHYRLQRDLELVLADAGALFGNGWLLPAGPLREPLARLAKADALILTQRGEMAANFRASAPVFSVVHAPAGFRRLADKALAAALPTGGRMAQAITAIARPAAFFALLKSLGVACQPRAFPDHHLFSAADRLTRRHSW